MPVSYPYVQYTGIWKLNSASAAKGAGTWPVPPGAPTIGTASVVGSNASVTFTAPANLGIPAVIISYTVTSSPGGLTGTGASSPITVTGFTQDQAYTFTVTATNASGTGPPSAASNSIVPSPSSYLYSWGRNNFGQLGQGNTTDQSSPVQVGALGNWNFITGGSSSSLAIKSNGTLWSWGANNRGVLGLGNTTYYSSPKQIGSLTTWSQATSGTYSFALAIQTNGTLWSWGSNNAGQLGLGDSTNRSSPVQIGALTNWLSVSAGGYFVLAIKTDGTLWSWGKNNEGQLGLGNITYYSSPKQVGSLTNWLSVSASGYASTIAIKTDGTLWSWGYGGFGQLGLGNATSRSSPVQVGALTSWSQISSSVYSSFAIKTNGTLWSWGDNSQGQLGLGNTISYSSPVQVGALTSWTKLPNGGSTKAGSMGAIQSGKLFTWGYNNRGQLGLNNTTSYSSPVQVGAATTWINFSMPGVSDAIFGLATRS